MEPQFVPVPLLHKLVGEEKDIASLVREHGRFLNATCQLRGKDITVVIGSKGAGKSTLCQALTCPNSVEYDEDELVYIVKQG